MRLPLHLRLASWVVLVSYLNLLCPVSLLWAQVKSPPAAPAINPVVLPPPVRTPGHVTVNHTLPEGTMSAGAVVHAFSASPTNQEILRCGILPDPLVPVGKPTTPDENAALAQALLGYRKAGGADHVQPFLDFLARYPGSAWAASLHLNLGLTYFSTGWFDHAFDEYAAAWTLSKTATDPHGQAVGDRSIGELLELNARLGRADVLAKLLDEIKGRAIHGSAQVLVNNAREALWSMQHHPELSFRCGPGALQRILAHQPKPVMFSAILHDSHSTPKGISLTEVCKLSQAVGLNYQMARRSPGAPIITPAVIHWKVGHYAALISFHNGVGQLQDPTFGNAYTASLRALDSESSGYFLVPPGPLPPGWQPVSAAEGDTIWGKGLVSLSQASCTTPTDLTTPPSSIPCGGMPVASATLMVCSLHLEDTPLFYTPPKGPAVSFNLIYNQREAGQPDTFTYGNVSSLWTFGWLSYVSEQQQVVGYDGNNPNSFTYTPTAYLIGGGSEPYPASGVVSDPALASYDFGYQETSRNHLVKTDVNTYVQYNPDGSSYVYGFHNGTNYFLSQIVDPAGNALTLGYDSASGRLTSVTDALGQVTSIAYVSTDSNSPGYYQVQTVTDPFHRSCTLSYNSSGELSQITDMDNMSSSFTYSVDGSNFISSMTTPYGTSKFAWDQGQASGERWLTLTDPLGNTERVEFYDDAGNNAGTSYPAVGPAPTGMTTFTAFDEFRNTFYWDKRAYSQWPDRTVAHTYHWLHTQENINVCSGILENEKNAAEGNRIWYNYPDQSSPIDTGSFGSPTKIGRVLDNGASQVTQYTYNSLGKVLTATDPLGRTTTNTYDPNNNIDLLETDIATGPNGQHDVLAKFTYNNQHEILTATDAAGQQTTYTYNPAGQPHTVTDAKNETTTYWYTPDGSPVGSNPDPNASGYLVETVGPTGGITTFTYDGYGRVRTVTDPEGYAITTDYDSLNRPTQLTYPDGTTTQNVYDRLDLAFQVDRLGRVTQFSHNALRQLVMVTDPLGRRTTYDRCGCGALQAITDAAGNTTRFDYDIQGRQAGKTYPDGTRLTYAYETATSRRKSVTDARGQVTNYSYNLDDTLQQVVYTDTSGNPLVPATPSVSYTFDPFYPRMTSMTDGTGTTNYTYEPAGSLGAGRLFTATSPLANSTITYTYDQLGRATGTSINGSANASSVAYDVLGRVQTATNPLGSFIYNYVSAVSSRLQSVIYPNGQATGYGYYGIGTPGSNPNDGNDDLRLQTIQNVLPGNTPLSSFGYAYDHAGRITTWVRQTDSNPALTAVFGYDAADQLTAAAVQTSSAVTDYNYIYDQAGNRTSEQINNGVSAATVNNLNQVTGISPSGPIHFTGTLNEPANVTVNGVAAAVDSSNNFAADIPLSAGANVVTVAATNGNGVKTTKHYQYTVANGVSRTLTYDLDGNLVNDGAGKTYTYDAANRLTSITQTVNGVQTVNGFVYDGLGRRVQEILNGTIIKQWVWCLGFAQPCEERDASSNVTKRFYGQGEILLTGANAGTYYFSKDHLGSIREVTNSSAALVARYDYDPYGRRTLISGIDLADFGFDGMYYHQASRLDLTLYRVYDPNLARWLSRDPIGEEGDINIYRFVNNNPIKAIDPLGLCEDAEDADNLDNDYIDHLSNEYNKTAKELGEANARGDWAEAQRLKGQLNDISKQLGADPDNPGPAPSNLEFRAAPDDSNTPKPTSPNQMQKQVERDQAPPDVERVDPAHVNAPNQQPHVHYTDGTSSNQDGSTHDAVNGEPNPSQATRDWLSTNGWTPPPKK